MRQRMEEMMQTTPETTLLMGEVSQGLNTIIQAMDARTKGIIQAMDARTEAIMEGMDTRTDAIIRKRDNF